jgi:hypothetical protein
MYPVSATVCQSCVYVIVCPVVLKVLDGMLQSMHNGVRCVGCVDVCHTR